MYSILAVISSFVCLMRTLPLRTARDNWNEIVTYQVEFLELLQ